METTSFGQQKFYGDNDIFFGWNVHIFHSCMFSPNYCLQVWCRMTYFGIFICILEIERTFFIETNGLIFFSCLNSFALINRNSCYRFACIHFSHAKNASKQISINSILKFSMVFLGFSINLFAFLFVVRKNQILWRILQHVRFSE